MTLRSCWRNTTSVQATSCDHSAVPSWGGHSDCLRLPGTRGAGCGTPSISGDGRRIWCENCRLNKESERLATEAARLAEKLKNCPHDLDAKFKLLREEATYAKDANRNAVRRAKLECKQADYCTQKNKLEEKHNELFPVRD